MLRRSTATARDSIDSAKDDTRNGSTTSNNRFWSRRYNNNYQRMGVIANNNNNSSSSSNINNPRHRQRLFSVDSSLGMILILSFLGILLVLFFGGAYNSYYPSWSHNGGMVVTKLEHEVEQEIAFLWKEFHDVHGNLPPIPQHEHEQLQQQQQQHEQDEMGWSQSKVTGTSWVQGEILLKQGLERLAARQAQGLDLGVPVLSRWLGSDLPVWPDETVASTEAWQAQVDARLAAMHEEEMAWRKHMGQFLQQQDEQRGKRMPTK